jgi:hypothetical protein
MAAQAAGEMMSIGKYEVLVGDVNFLEHGGTLIDAMGRLWHIEEPCDDMRKEKLREEWRWEVYQLMPERLTKVVKDRKIYYVESCIAGSNRVLEVPWMYEPWFIKRLGEVASASGGDVKSLYYGLCSSEPKTLGGAYIDIATVYGWYEFDSYPQSYTEHEVHALFEVEGCNCNACLCVAQRCTEEESDV